MTDTKQDICKADTIGVIWMSDLIRRQDAIDALDRRFDSIPMEQTTEICLLRKDLRELPSAHPEIVMCKNCKHWEYDAIFPDGWCRGKQQGNPEWFCADAERRTDETD